MSLSRRAVEPSRVPDPSVTFWVAKAASTALGEAVSDFSIRALDPVVAVLLGFAFFVVALAWQLTRRRYVPGVYWLAVAAVGVFGTMAADVVHIVIGLPYVASAALYAIALAAVFVLWRRIEGTFSVHDVTTTRREFFYWAAVVGTFALGTAVGDLTAVTLGLGYGTSIAAFAVAIAVPFLGWRFARWDAVLSFWFAYVLTRPLGASVADWLGKPVAEGGVGLGSEWVSLGLAAVMVALVAVMQARRRPPAAVELEREGGADGRR
ncbi:COG4705 family protein [Microbacterium enclense]|uniref:COG4705 family protein n=1 Tax=Microbacterium enclense TaxID=993073 RepID=UPI003F814815